MRFGAATPESAALLAQVCERAAECGLDPELPLPDAIPMLRLTVSLSRAARQAEGTETAQPRSSDRRVAQHEAPAEPAQEGPAAENIMDYPMQSAPEAPDNNRRTAWQLDRTPERPIARRANAVMLVLDGFGAGAGVSRPENALNGQHPFEPHGE